MIVEVNLVMGLSIKSITISFLNASITLAALPRVKVVSLKLTVRLAISFALACAVAFPFKLNVAVVEPVLVSTAVNPGGTLLTVAPVKAAPSASVKVSLIMVSVEIMEILPSLA